MEASFVNPQYERRIKELERKVAKLEALRGAGLEEIKQVVELTGKKTVNEKLKRGWVLLDAKVIQLGPESQKAGAVCYILGRKNAI